TLHFSLFTFHSPPSPGTIIGNSNHPLTTGPDLMKSSVPVALVGIAGYGETYLSAFLDHPGEHGFDVVGLVDPAPQRCSRIDELRARNIPIYADLNELYAHAQPKLTMLATPIHL